MSKRRRACTFVVQTLSVCWFDLSLCSANIVVYMLLIRIQKWFINRQRINTGIILQWTWLDWKHICFQSSHVHCNMMPVLIRWRFINHFCILINNMYTTMLAEQSERSNQQTDSVWTTKVHALRRLDNPSYYIEFSLCIQIYTYIYIYIYY